MSPGNWKAHKIENTEVQLSGMGPWTLSGHCHGNFGSVGRLVAGFGAKVTSGGKTLSMTNYNGTQNEFDVIRTVTGEEPPAKWNNYEFVRLDLIRNLASNANCSVIKILGGSGPSTWRYQDKAGSWPEGWPWGGEISGLEAIWIRGCSQDVNSRLNFKLHLMKNEYGIIFIIHIYSFEDFRRNCR